MLLGRGASLGVITDARTHDSNDSSDDEASLRFSHSVHTLDRLDSDLSFGQRATDEAESDQEVWEIHSDEVSDVSLSDDDDASADNPDVASPNFSPAHAAMAPTGLGTIREDGSSDDSNGGDGTPSLPAVSPVQRQRSRGRKLGQRGGAGTFIDLASAAGGPLPHARSPRSSTGSDQRLLGDGEKLASPSSGALPHGLSISQLATVAKAKAKLVAIKHRHKLERLQRVGDGARHSPGQHEVRGNG